MLMSGQAEADRRAGRAGLGRFAILAVKLVITGACFTYLARTVDIAHALGALRRLDPWWGILAVLVLCLQIPMVGLRLRAIVNAIDAGAPPVQRIAAIAISAIGGFFAQVMPNLAAETVRVWMLTKVGHGWRPSLLGVMLDRAVGVFLLVVLGFVVLLFPSELRSLGGHLGAVMLFLGTVSAVAIVGLLFAPGLAAILELWRYTRWAGTLARVAHKVLLESAAGLVIFGLAFFVQVLTIVSIWLLGRALGLALPILDAGVLFIPVSVIALIPVSISGWGVRELAVTTLLTAHGVPPEQSLAFSVSFGLALLIAALPGALVWATYSPKPAEPAPAQGR